LPCSSCGRFDAQALLEFLVKKKKGEWYGGKKAFSHIKAMKDVFGVVLEDYNAASTCTDVDDADSSALFMCPVTSVPMNGFTSTPHIFVTSAIYYVNNVDFTM